ncbi:FHA domain-containing serine/threonine-protein kinase [Nannocystis bainbridge]|uniref:FHA domain-containing serine/threonine-protein kinase n=1 Tax=Nannocystis bainbridge TaxID=2995303 RepID=A0ABT5E4S3_9BACT|nr:FHA domain-containing serine/threonine-protein kinase [Nannocystis bainbridge]MDC0719731.1 FHA domain-containing serine/threonine-protein kinase [Nannocystis bainbridge]
MQPCPYRKIRPLGEGSMGDVHLCVDVQQRRLVVVKWLRAELHEGSQAAVRFRREAELMAGANFPGVIKVEEWGLDEFGRTWMAMEFVDGLMPSAVVGPGDCWSVHRLLAGVGQGLDDLHGLGVVHRDLKPENVLLRSSVDGWEPVIIDLGIAKWLAQETATASGSVFGTPHYMSPEQCRDTKHVGPATDRYAVAVIIFELMAGRRPFEGRTIPELLRQHLESPVPELQIPKRVRSGAIRDTAAKATYPSPNLDAFMRKAMAKEPRLRFGSGKEMTDEFERAAKADGLWEIPDPSDMTPLFPALTHPMAEIIIDGESRQRFDVRHGPLVLGRHESCQVVLGSPRLSRLHACVYLHRGRVWAADLHSQNGTLFQGRALQPGVPMPFPPGGQTAVFTLYNRNIAVRLCTTTGA